MLTMFATMLITILSTIFIMLWILAGIATLMLDKIPKFAFFAVWFIALYMLIEIFWIK